MLFRGACGSPPMMLCRRMVLMCGGLFWLIERDLRLLKGVFVETIVFLVDEELLRRYEREVVPNGGLESRDENGASAA
jgi:hypothetical protein